MRAFILAFLLCNIGLAQNITVRVTDSKDGHPLSKRPVSAQFLFENPTRTLPLVQSETNSNGEAQFSLPEPIPDHLNVRVTLDPEPWHCACWLMTDTHKIVRTGIVQPAPSSSGKAPSNVAPKPGEIVFVARELSFFERLLSPLVKD